MKLNSYRFNECWAIPAPLEVVWERITDLRTYPEWWPEFQEATVLDGCTGLGARVAVHVKAALPYHMRFELEIVRYEPMRLTEVCVRGDLNGFMRWTLEPMAGGTRLSFEEEVRTGKLLLNLLAPIAKPFFAWNHTSMMENGERGLRAYLAARLMLGPPCGASRGLELLDFNPEQVAYYEAAGWQAYYARNWPRVFGLLVSLIDSQFRIPFPQSFLAALHVVRAELAFIPRDHDLAAVLHHLERFYSMAARANGEPFDPRQVAALELSYWVIHRELSGNPDKRPFVDIMTALHVAIFGRTPDAMRPSAESRVAANNTVDILASGRSTNPIADWRNVEEHLRRAYWQVKQA